MSKTKVAILGSTGSVGTQTLDVIRTSPDRYEVVGLACGSNAESLFAQAAEFNVRTLCVGDQQATVPQTSNGTTLLRGSEGLCEVAAGTGADVVMVATVGDAGFAPTVAAIENGTSVALASKEMLVMGGSLIADLARSSGAKLLPIDSEHSALWQCLRGENQSDISKLILTASGGPFRETPAEAMESVTPRDALKHPTWKMGAKITIDCATLMNKGLEVIEAHWLFDIPYGSIEVLIHPESVVHSMVEFVDGSVKAQLGSRDMRLPISYALSYPDRQKSIADRMDFANIGNLHFSEPDNGRFPLLNASIRAGLQGGSTPAILCGADDAAVALFLAGRISFPMISELVLRVLDEVDHEILDDLEAVPSFHRAGFEAAMDLAKTHSM